MYRILVCAWMVGLVFSTGVSAQGGFEVDTLKTSGGDLEITFIGHGTLMFRFEGKVIHVDPVGRYADYGRMPKADLVLVTHHHGDHLDGDAIGRVRKPETVLVVTEACAGRVDGGVVMGNGAVKTVAGLEVRAAPAYNLVHKRENGQVFHPKGVGNGYVIGFGKTRVYVAGDTEDVPEMADLEGVDCAFLPMNLPYTMTPEMVAHAVAMIRPRILYPYHFGKTDTGKLVGLLKDREDVEVRIRKMH